MKTTVYTIKKDRSNMEAVLAEVEKAAGYGELDKKESIRLRLLAEELIGMIPELLEYCSCEFWAECSGKAYELHASAVLEDILSADREKLMEISTSHKNAAAKGIMSKIRVAAETMFVEYLAMPADVYYDFYSMGTIPEPYYYTSIWSLSQYKEAAKEDEAAWDELEKSIIANLADDVVVGIKGKKVDIIVKKSFE